MCTDCFDGIIGIHIAPGFGWKVIIRYGWGCSQFLSAVRLEFEFGKQLIRWINCLITDSFLPFLAFIFFLLYSKQIAFEKTNLLSSYVTKKKKNKKKFRNARVHLTGVTILLSLTVFLNMVAETMPATSDAVPLLGKLFASIMSTACVRLQDDLVCVDEWVSSCRCLISRGILSNLEKSIYVY